MKIGISVVELFVVRVIALIFVPLITVRDVRARNICNSYSQTLVEPLKERFAGIQYIGGFHFIPEVIMKG